MSPRAISAAIFSGSFILFGFLFLATPSIPDADSYFHLAVARAYGTTGIFDGLPWARMSVLGQHFGDKDLLFHIYLIPFASWMDAAVGGRIALAMLNAGIVTVIGYCAIEAVGPWGALLPLWLYVATPPFFGRVIRLRPELLALILLLLFVRVAAARRYRWTFAIALLFALSYTAWHVFVGLAILWFLADRDRDWRLVAATTGGTALGLIARPGFPWNLKVWWLQNVTSFLLRRSSLDIGAENLSATTSFVFVQSAGFWIGLLCLGIGLTAGPAPRRRRLVLFSAIAMLVFAVLFAWSERMAIYFAPLAALTIVYAMPSLRQRTALALAASMLLSLPTTLHLCRRLFAGTGTPVSWEADYQAFGRNVPRGATVAAQTSMAEFYAFWAPQGRYLNVLDPIFMAVPHPDVHAAVRAVFDGVEPDVPLVAKTLLASDFIAFDATTSRVLDDRLRFDPRVQPLYTGYNFLGRLLPANSSFVVDWSGYPRINAFEGYVDALRMAGSQPCVRMQHDEIVARPETRIYEFAPYGTASIDVDGSSQFSIHQSLHAVVGKGMLVKLALTAGPHRFTVETCRDETGRSGFYLIRRR